MLIVVRYKESSKFIRFLQKIVTEAFHHFGGRLLGNNDDNTKL